MANVGALFDGNGIFLYRGGKVPEHLKQRITRARIDKPIKVISEYAFNGCTNLLDVETHDGITKIKRAAFHRCISLGGINLPGVSEVEGSAFDSCGNLTDVEFGVELERIGRWAFNSCRSLRRIAMPFKHIDFVLEDDATDRQTQFHGCHNLATVDLVGGIHKTISSLHMESWRDEMKEEVHRINRVLPDTDSWIKTSAIQQWIESVTGRIEHYKTLHNTLLKEATTLLE